MPDSSFIRATVAAQAIDAKPIYTSSRSGVSEQELQEISAGKDFGYRNETEVAVKKTEKEKEQKRSSGSWFSDFIEFLFVGAGRFILWGLLFAAIGFAVYKFVIGDKTFMFGKRARSLAPDSDELTEEDLLEVNWQQRLDEAVKRGDLRLAVRFSYMWLLQLFQERGLIQYRIDKTNYDYIAELDDKAWKQPFRQVVRQYEFSWYGQYPITEQQYHDFQVQFQSLKNQLR